MAEAPLKVGFVGCGGISRMLYAEMYAGLADIAQVVAVADLVDELAEERRRMLTEVYLAEAHEARLLAEDARTPGDRQANLKRAEAAEAASAVRIRKYRSHEELLKNDEVQVVVLLTPPSVRGEPIIAAAETGRHVFTQGPMACSVAEADAIVAAIRRAGVKFHSQCGSRYPRGMVLAYRAVESGHMGKMGSARVELNGYKPQSYYTRWHGTWDGEGGGAVFHHGRYIIDPFLWVVGCRVAEVFAYSGPQLRQIEHDSLTEAVLRFENGAYGTIHASLISHRQQQTTGGRIEVLGQYASLLVGEAHHSSPVAGSPRGNYWQADTTFGSSDNPAAVEALEALRTELARIPEQATEEYQSRLFLESIINDTEMPVPIEVPRNHVEVVRAIYKSAEEHQPVTLPLDKNDPFYSRQGRLTSGVKPPSQ